MRLTDAHIYQIAKATGKSVSEVREVVAILGHLGLWVVIERLNSRYCEIVPIRKIGNLPGLVKA